MVLLKYLVYFVFFVELLTVHSASFQDDETVLPEKKLVTIQTSTGLLQGELVGYLQNSGNPWFRFQGIPYAEAPVGSLRFEVSLEKCFKYFFLLWNKSIFVFFMINIWLILYIT